MAKTKQLTLNTINKLSSQLDKKKQIHIDIDGQLFTVTIATKFKKSVIQDVVLKYLMIMDDARTRKDVDELQLMKATSLINTLIITHFSDIPLPEAKNIEDLITASETLLNLGIMEKLFNDGFDPAELELLNVELLKHTRSIGKMIGELSLKAAMQEEDANNGVQQSE